jgi:hypothetical protein
MVYVRRITSDAINGFSMEAPRDASRSPMMVAAKCVAISVGVLKRKVDDQWGEDDSHASSDAIQGMTVCTSGP